MASTIIEIPEGEKYHFVRHWDNEHSIDILDKKTLEIDAIVEYPLGFVPRMAYFGHSDTTYYLAGKQQGLPQENDTDYHLSYLTYNHKGEMLNQNTYKTDSPIMYIGSCFSINENYIYFAGNYPFSYNPPFVLEQVPRWILFYKLTKEGEVVWQKFYKGEVNYMPYVVLATPYGGALIFSTRYNWNDSIEYQRDVHIMKIDSNGYYTPLAVNESVLYDNQILVYPNPVKDYVNFEFGLYQDLEIRIYNLEGQLMLSENFKNSASINITGYSPGTYLYIIKGKKGFVEKGKLVKQ